MTGRPVAVVTGGTSGIGRAVADRLRADGYRVISVSRTATGDDEYQADVSDPHAVDRLVESVLADTGRVDALVTSAGMVERGPLSDTPRERLDRQVEVNLMGTMYVCRGFADALDRHGGAIVTVSSSIAASPQPGVGAYAAAKGGVEALTRVLALELAPRVRVNAVRPALVETGIWIDGGMTAEDYQELVKRRAAEYPMGRVGQPEDVAAAVSFLLSSQAAWITGVVLPVDGGSGLVGR